MFSPKITKYFLCNYPHVYDLLNKDTNSYQSGNYLLSLFIIYRSRILGNNKINAAAPEKVVYVSCNPATQARDLALMDEFYQVTRIQPVDMFPHTHHVENVVLLERRVV